MNDEEWKRLNVLEKECQRTIYLVEQVDCIRERFDSKHSAIKITN